MKRITLRETLASRPPAHSLSSTIPFIVLCQLYCTMPTNPFMTITMMIAAVLSSLPLLFSGDLVTSLKITQNLRVSSIRLAESKGSKASRLGLVKGIDLGYLLTSLIA